MKSILSTLFATAALWMSAANPIPPDPSVRIGTLDNGLTYYIRQNTTPAGQADFFLAQRVGSVNEDDSQQGLAHFLEHMCFNWNRTLSGQLAYKLSRKPWREVRSQPQRLHKYRRNRV